MSSSEEKLTGPEENGETIWDETMGTSEAIAEDLKSLTLYPGDNTEVSFTDESISNKLPDGRRSQLDGVVIDILKNFSEYSTNLHENGHFADAVQDERGYSPRLPRDSRRHSIELEEVEREAGRYRFDEHRASPVIRDNDFLFPDLDLPHSPTEASFQRSRFYETLSRDAEMGAGQVFWPKTNARASWDGPLAGSYAANDNNNDIPSSIFPYLSIIPDKALPGILHKRRKEILCEQLDTAQRKLLRDERIARVYYNPIPTYKEPQERERDRLNMSERKSVHDRFKLQTRMKERLKKTCKIYGAKCKMLDSKYNICQEIKKLPPYRGPHAYRVTAYEMMNSKPKVLDYQFVSKNSPKVDRISAADYKDLTRNRQPTTPHAIWRRQRFLSPEGCDYRLLKEQLRCAKYKSMLETLTAVTDEDKVAFGNTTLWQHSVPVDCLRHSADWDGRLRTGKSLTRTPSLDDYTGIRRESAERLAQVLRRARMGNLRTDDNGLEHLLLKTEMTRRRLSSCTRYRPKGEFVPDPRQNPIFLKQCGRKTKSNQ